MKRRIILLLPLAMLIAAVLLVPPGRTQEADPIDENVKRFMRAKLVHAQDVLEGLTTENFPQITAAAQEMSLRRPD